MQGETGLDLGNRSRVQKARLETKRILPNIVKVVRDGLCTGCGTCAGVCPANAVSLHVIDGLYVPEVAGNCTDCGLCLRCCPGYSASLNMNATPISDRKLKDAILGNFISSYLGHSNNSDILHNSTSGGVVTELLSYALETGIIDGALVVRMRQGKPLEPEPFIARNREEIASASKSKYCPVPTNIALEKILSEKGKFAVVGLPCHIYGIRKAEAALPQLKSKIVLHIGLFCSHTVSFLGTDFLLRKFGVSKDQVKSFEYRGNGWPSRTSILLKDGRKLSLRFNQAWNACWNIFSPFFYAPMRCIMCGNQLNESADVSFGDAWLPELRRSGKYDSVIITWTAIGDELLNRMKQDRVISLRNVSPAKVKEAQAFSLNFKKDNLPGRLSFLRMLGKKTPSLDAKFRLLALPSSLLTYLSFRTSSSKRFGRFLAFVPLPVFRLYFGLFRCSFLLSRK